MLVITQSETYKWPVKVLVAADGGRFDESKFTAVFKRLTQSRIQEISSAEDMTDKVLAVEVLQGWEGVQDADGNDVPFNTGNRDKLFDLPSVATTIVMAFMESLAGAKRKN